MDNLGKSLFSGKLDVEINIYHPDKSVAITIPGLSHPVFASWKSAYTYTGGIKASEKSSGKAKPVAKKIKATGNKKIGTSKKSAGYSVS